MPEWPTEFQGSHFTGKFLSFTGEPVSGTITFTPSTVAVISTASKTIVSGGSITRTLDADGAFDVILPATDDPDTNPTGWTYLVTEAWPGGRKYSVSAPMNQTQDLTAVVPVPASAGNAIVRGQSAYEFAVAGGYTDTEAQFQADLAAVGGSGSPDATTTVKGLVQLAGDLGGTSAAPTVPGLAGKAPTVHTHTASQVSDSTATGRAVLTAADATAARAAIGAGTSDLTLGATGTTAAAGNHTHTAAAVTDFAEALDDRVAALVVAGANVTKTYDDTAGTLTLAAKTTAAAKSVIVTAPAVSSYVIWQAPKPVTITGVRGFRNGGTGATINAQVNALDLLAADLSLPIADTWLTAPSVQNAAMAAGDALKVAVRSVAGSPAYITFQIDYQEA